MGDFNTLLRHYPSSASNVFCVTDNFDTFDALSSAWEKNNVSFTKLRITPLDPVFAFSPIGVDSPAASVRFFDFFCSVLRVTEQERKKAIFPYIKKILSPLYLMTDTPTLGMIYELIREDDVAFLSSEEKLHFYTFMVSPLIKHFNTESRVDFSTYTSGIVDISVVLSFIGADHAFWNQIFRQAISSCILDSREGLGLDSQIFNILT